MTSSRSTIRFRLLPVALVAFAALSQVARADEVVIKMASLVPKDSVWERTLKEMGEQWKQASKGQVRLVLYSGGVQGDDTDVVRKMRLGTIGAGLLTSSGITEIDRGVLALEIPLAYRDWNEFDCTLLKMTPQLEKQLLDKGFVLLAWSDGGWIKFFSKNPVKTPDDLRQQKLFTWAGDDFYVELWKQAGFNPVPLPATELQTAIQTGLVNAMPTTPQVAVLMQYYENAKHMTDLNWAALLGGIVISAKVWDKVPADAKPAMIKAARDAGKKLSDLSRQTEPKDVDAMKKRGLDVVTVDAAAYEKWQQLALSVYPKVRGRFMPADVMDAALKTRDECRAAAGKSGPR